MSESVRPGQAAARWSLRRLAGVCVLLTGCSTMAPEPVVELTPEARQAMLGRVDTYEVSGKLGVWSDEQALSSRFVWHQSGDFTNVRLTAPLGLGQWQLSDSSAAGAALQRGTEPPWRDASLDRLVQRALALDSPVPVSQLRFWLKGAVGAGRSSRFDEFGRLESLRYVDPAGASWQMKVLRYAAVDAVELPALIVAQGSVRQEDGQTESYRLRLVLDEWRPSDSTVALPETPSEGSPPVAPGPKRLPIPGR